MNTEQIRVSAERRQSNDSLQTPHPPARLTDKETETLETKRFAQHDASVKIRFPRVFWLGSSLSPRFYN